MNSKVKNTRIALIGVLAVFVLSGCATKQGTKLDFAKAANGEMEFQWENYKDLNGVTIEPVVDQNGKVISVKVHLEGSGTPKEFFATAQAEAESRKQLYSLIEQFLATAAKTGANIAAPGAGALVPTPGG